MAQRIAGSIRGAPIAAQAVAGLLLAFVLTGCAASPGPGTSRPTMAPSEQAPSPTSTSTSVPTEGPGVVPAVEGLLPDVLPPEVHAINITKTSNIGYFGPDPCSHAVQDAVAASVGKTGADWTSARLNYARPNGVPRFRVSVFSLPGVAAETWLHAFAYPPVSPSADCPVPPTPYPNETSRLLVISDHNAAQRDFVDDSGVAWRQYTVAIGDALFAVQFSDPETEDQAARDMIAVASQ